MLCKRRRPAVISRGGAVASAQRYVLVAAAGVDARDGGRHELQLRKVAAVRGAEDEGGDELPLSEFLAGAEGDALVAAVDEEAHRVLLEVKLGADDIARLELLRVGGEGAACALLASLRVAPRVRRRAEVARLRLKGARVGEADASAAACARRDDAHGDGDAAGRVHGRVKKDCAPLVRRLDAREVVGQAQLRRAVDAIQPSQRLHTQRV